MEPLYPAEPFVWFLGNHDFWVQCQNLMMLLTGLDSIWGIWN